ncbi:MAG: T9SS type A sorting domain-containing protein [Bacteroidetes bacterium]|nr:T9SS type A sorting domain-containing protein [Bacteroidota bacterium]
MKSLILLFVLVLALGTLHGQRWVPLGGPNGGTFDELTVSTTDPNIIATRIMSTDKFYYTTNGGTTWQLFASVPTGWSGGLYDLRFVPGTAQTLQLIAYGALHETSNFGVSWRKVFDLPASSPFNKVRKAPGTTSTWLAWGNALPVVRTTNNGAHWDTVIATRPSTVAISSVLMSEAAPRRMWTALRDSIYESVDTGATWTKVTYTGILGYSISLKCADLTDSTRLYAYFQGRIGVSTDYGRTWSDRTGKNILTTTGIEQDRETPNIMWSWGTNVLRSTDRGMSWTPADTMNPTRMNAALVGHILTLACYEGGILRGTATGAPWQRIENGLAFVSVRRIHAITDAHFYLEGTNDVIETTNGGETWKWLTPVKYDQPSGGRVYSFDVCNASTQNMVGGTNSEIYHSTDAGRTWLESNPRQNIPIYTVSYHPTNANDVVVGGMFTIKRSSNGGASWTSIQSPSFGYIKELYRATDPMRMIALESGTLYTSSDGGTTWTKREGSGSTPTVVTVDPTGSANFIGSVYSTILRSTDGGATWTSLSTLTDQPAELLVDPHATDNIYAATSTGTLLRLHRGNSVVDTLYNSSYPNERFAVNALHINGTTILAAGDKGIARFDPTPVSVATQQTSVGGTIVVPNPCADHVHLVLDESFTASVYEVRVEIFDMLGNRMIDVMTDPREAIVNVSILPPGAYALRVSDALRISTTTLQRQ